METIRHRTLKRLAVQFLRERGCLVAAQEVRCPLTRYLVDAAGYIDRGPPDRAATPARVPPQTVLVECKQERGDFLRDSARTDALLARRGELERLRGLIEERRIKVHEPHLRRGGVSLFAELEEWDFARSRLRGYRQVQRELRRLDRLIYGQTKFFMIAHYRLADELYLAAPRGMIDRRELPAGWGLLEVPMRRRAHPAAIRMTVEATPLAARPEHRQRLLRNIAVAACRDLMRLDGALG
jgi:hypothetical protein